MTDLSTREAEANLALWEADPEFAESVGVSSTWRGTHGICVRQEREDRADGCYRYHYHYHTGIETIGSWWEPGDGRLRRAIIQ